ncbi:MAG: hypothetical protein JRC90_11550 [Deltaproteobacteria bacterium]|nr:hypothetical protein [Deltaproteobacteria bacterium]
MAKKCKKTAGRPKLKIDWGLVDSLLNLQCTGEEIAGFINISYDTLERRCKTSKKKNFKEYSKLKRVGGKASLRRKQWLLADTNPAMAIFLGKQYLDQADKIHQEHTGKDGKPLIPENTKIKVEYCQPKQEK